MEFAPVNVSEPNFKHVGVGIISDAGDLTTFFFCFLFPEAEGEAGGFVRASVLLARNTDNSAPKA